MSDELYDPRQHGALIPSGAAEPYDPQKHGALIQAQGRSDALGGAVGRGVAMGGGDELAASIRAAAPGLSNWMMRGPALQRDASIGGSPAPRTVSAAPTYDERYAEELAKFRGQSAADDAAYPALTMAGKVAGGVAGTAAISQAPVLRGLMTPAGGLLANTAKGVATGGILGGAQGFAEGEGGLDERLKGAKEGAIVGGAVGGAIPAVLGGARRMITPIPADTSPARAAAIKVLEDANVPLSAGNRTGSVGLQRIEDQVAKLPMSGTFGYTRNPAWNQMEAFTEAVGKKSGVDAKEITSDVLNKGFDRIGGTIGNIQKQFSIAGDDVLPGLAKIDVGILQPGQQSVVNTYINRMLQPSLAPKDASALRTQLRLAISGQNGHTGDPIYKTALVSLKDTLDDGLEKAITKSGKADMLPILQEARQQYANLNVLSDALYSSGAAGQVGRLTPTALQTAQARSLGKRNYMSGKGDLTPLASASSAIMRAPKDSGTASNLATANPLKWAASIPLNAAINSRPAQAYLGNQLLPGRRAIPFAPTLGGILGIDQ